ncbi:hypothetical protein [Streptomyces cyaneofuscatus]|uniref:hypothetical protein n=1 Tax=Streptomyces cyaneofuscatus TaxID=66883 RepID=UPI0036D87811
MSSPSDSEQEQEQEQEQEPELVPDDPYIRLVTGQATYEEVLPELERMQQEDPLLFLIKTNAMIAIIIQECRRQGRPELRRFLSSFLAQMPRYLAHAEAVARSREAQEERDM